MSEIEAGAFQFRYTEINECCCDFGELKEWVICTPKKFKEINDYIQSGYTHYETRKLYAQE